MINKPMLLTTDDLAEGVYAASGDNPNGGNSGGMTVEAGQAQHWGGNNQYDYKVTLPDGLSNKIKITFVFNDSVNSFYGGGGGNPSGLGSKTVTLTFENPQKSFTVSAQSASDSLSIVSYKVENV